MRPPKVARTLRTSTSLKVAASSAKSPTTNGTASVGKGYVRSPGTSPPGTSGLNGNAALPLRNGRTRVMHASPEFVEDGSGDKVNTDRKRRRRSSPELNGQPLVKKACIGDDRVTVDRVSDGEPLDTSPKFAFAYVVTSKERQFKWAIRLYRYLNTKNSAFDSTARSRIFLKRNLVYMNPKVIDLSLKSDNPTLGPTYKKKRTPDKTPKQKRENLMGLLERLHKDRRKKSSFGSPSDRILSCFMTKNDLNLKSPTKSPSKASDKTSSSSEPTAVLKFLDVRNKDLPGTRRAKITVFTTSEIDGSFNEIHRLQAATTFMEVNNKRNKPVGIDLPHAMNFSSPGKHKKRNDYVILRVTFSEEENAKISGGRTLRCVPSRQAETAEPKVTRRSSANKAASSSSSNDDALVMYGARCVASFLKGNTSSGIIFGDGSINLVPSDWLDSRGGIGRDGSLAKRLLELGKKNHTGPFVKITVAADAGEESSSSEEDDETKSCSTSRSTSVCSSRSRSQSSIFPLEKPASNASEDSFQSFLRARFKRELSLEFPKEICYRFFVRYSDEPDTSFPESVFRRISDMPPNWAFCSPSKDLTENIANGHKTPTKRVPSPTKETDVPSPLREVKRYNGIFCSPPGSAKDGSDTFKTPTKLTNGFRGKSRQHPSRLNSLAVGFTFDELLSDQSIEDYSLVETIDNCGAMGQFDKFFIPSPKKAVYRNDIACPFESPESCSSSAPDVGIITRCVAPANKCFFCLGTFPDMFALLLHMRTSYPRLDIIYKGDCRETAALNRAAPVYIDVLLRDGFDGSYEGSMSQQFRNFRSPSVPQRCVPNDRLTCLVLKGEARALRKVRRDLSMFFSRADRERRAMKGINAAYFGFRSRHPLMDSSGLSTKQTDQEWLRMYIIRQIEDFLDLSRLEKDFLIMWNIFLLSLDHKPFGRCQLYRTCRLFLQKHRQDLLARNLSTAWALHLSAFHERDALDSDEVYDLIMRLHDESYDPEKDVCHIVYSTRQRQKAATNVRKEPRWPKAAPIAGPKVSSLRSSSAAKLSTADTNSDNEELFKKVRESKEREERSSSYAGEERPKHGTCRRREPNLKYLSSPKIVRFLKNA